MGSKKKSTIFFTILILLLVVGGSVASFALPKLIDEELPPNPGPTTRFYVVNENEIINGKSLFYRMLIENREGTKVDYELKVRLGGDTIYSQQISLNHSGSFNETISFIPNQTEHYQKLEFLLFKDNETYRTRVSQVSSGIFSPEKKDTITKVETEPYLKEKNGDITVYKFNSGELLELTVSNGEVSKGNAIYSAAIKGKNIIFFGNMYEKAIPTASNVLYPVITEMKDKKLKIDETLNLKNGYAVTFKQINNRSLKLNISRNNRIIREIIGENSSIEYWKIISDYKKQKSIQIIPKQIYPDEIILDVIQYDDIETVIVGNKYGEFEVTEVTNNSIILTNIEPIKIEDGMDMSLINGKIKIKL